MIGELGVRFAVGGTLVALFALLGDLFSPKSFAGLFAAAPSVALATMILTLHQEEPAYVAAEARSMVFGAIAFFVYASSVGWLLQRRRTHPPVVAFAAILLWCVIAGVSWLIFVRER